MPDTQKVEIKPAKGRPMLQWVGKKPLREVIAYPAQLVETYSPPSLPGKGDGGLGPWPDWPEKFPQGGLLFHGDNKDVLAYLLANGFRGKVKLIYIDPPFNTGVDYVRKVVLKNISTEKLNAESYSFTEQIQYSANYHLDVFLQFLYDRLLLSKELLADDGVIFIRIDVHQEAHLRLLADEVFGIENFQNAVMVNRIKKNITDKGRRTIPHATDYLLVYFRSQEAEFTNVKKQLGQTKPGYWHGMESQGIPGPRQVIIEGKTYFPSPGTHFKFTQDQTDSMYAEGRIRVNPNSNKPEYWVVEKDYEHLDSNWTDISGYTFTTGYPTENSEKLLERVIDVASKPNDMVLDFFLGSGTTAAVAQKLGRRWIGADINKGAIQTTVKRLQGIIEEQARSPQLRLPLPAGEGEGETPRPAQFSFAVYRVNDYDLQIQHNEALNLACEHLGITRTKTDAFFDGVLGKKLVKIVPFNHPVTPLDLEEVKRELGNRPQEERDVVVVGYGKELAVQAWLEDWNRNRKRTGLPNQISVIDLRVDAKSGGFFIHKPAEAKVRFKRAGEKVNIEIEDFISPTIIERLKSQAGVLTPQIKDWRAMVDSVMIDTDYDGKVFNITLADVPEKKNDLVEGKYEVQAKKGAVIAVKITDMLGEETLTVKEI